MLFLGYLQIDLSLNGNPIDVQPPSISFSQIDSIYKLHSQCEFDVSDPNGYLQEYFGIAEGSELKLTFGSRYGDASVLNTSPYVVKKINLDNFAESGTLAGELNCKLVNVIYQKGEVANEGFHDRISNIVSIIMHRYTSIEKFDIDDTGNLDYWYRTQQADTDFIVDTLLPNTYSGNANNSPYFCFMTSDNVFHFRNLYSMLKANPVATFEYRVPSTTFDRENQSHLNLITGIREWHEGSDETKIYRHRNIYSVNRATGALNTAKDNITDYPSSEHGNLSIINDPNLTTGFLDLGYDETDIGRSENLKGQTINSTKDSSLIDRFLITTPFHPEVKAGNVVTVNFFIRDFQTSNYIISPNFSGNYLVEKSEHVFTGKSMKAYSMFNIGRKAIPNIPGTYDLRKKLMVMVG